MNPLVIDTVRTAVEQFFREYLGRISSLTLLWVSIILMHASLVPTYLAILGGLTDRYPPVDVILFVWAGLAALLVRSAVTRDWLNALTNSAGFVMHAVFLALVALS